MDNKSLYDEFEEGKFELDNIVRAWGCGVEEKNLNQCMENLTSKDLLWAWINAQLMASVVFPCKYSHLRSKQEVMQQALGHLRGTPLSESEKSRMGEFSLQVELHKTIAKKSLTEAENIVGKSFSKLVNDLNGATSIREIEKI